MIYAMNLEFINKKAVKSFYLSVSGIECNNLKHAKIQARKIGVRKETRQTKFLGVSLITRTDGPSIPNNHYKDFSVRVLDPNRPKYVNIECR